MRVVRRSVDDVMGGVVGRVDAKNVSGCDPAPVTPAGLPRYADRPNRASVNRGYSRRGSKGVRLTSSNT